MALGFEVIGLAKIYWVLYALFYDNRAITDLEEVNWFFLSGSALFPFMNQINGSPSFNPDAELYVKGLPQVR